MVKNGLRYAGLLALVLLVLSSALGCSGEEKKEAAKASQDPVPMKVIKAEVRNMPQWGEFVGQVSAKESVEVRARVAGFLQERKFEEGRQVKKGDLLFVIDPKPFQEDLKQAQAVVASNSALLTKSKKDYVRFKKLFDEGVVSRDEFESHQTERATYQAQLNDSKAKMENARIQLGYTKIYAPIDGLISRVQVDVGNLVGQGENTLLATISSQDPIYVSFSVSETDYIRAVRDQRTKEAGRAIKMILSDGSEYEQPGAFDMIDPTIDPQTGSLGIRVVFANPDNILRPGQYAKIRVMIAESQDAVVVPSVGVMDTQGMKSLYVVDEDGVIKSQPVKIGFETNNMIVIKEGLKAGDLVIVDGVRRVRPGMQIKPIVVPMTADGQSEAPAAAPAAEDKAE
ncbi:efflux RND transporter periplasmic adaptor subunit [Pseudodesulfovibrio sediminis]|uniref:MexE family multidrug efflux RND transporter periplasmic adaptor subunit n=1 Tax=Pseudodesulfovibrio sediminis TaxID=2810563 RepID=A0ABM7P4W1_9BACT|nr:efflux RND transporter periplasmic adaptor subunit [Pseudodesulfovibrio sediminis]BCS87940.1 MexE family multidrug efflux RND transporter periplasmic adaptor subunit [Pseudodesulfovibrio sediminis]